MSDKIGYTSYDHETVFSMDGDEELRGLHIQRTDRDVIYGIKFILGSTTMNTLVLRETDWVTADQMCDEVSETTTFYNLYPLLPLTIMGCFDVRIVAVYIPFVYFFVPPIY